MSNWYVGSQEDLDFLQHYGVLGMRWGVSRSRKYQSTKKKAKAQYKKQRAKAKTDNQKKLAKKKYKQTLADSRYEEAKKLYSLTDKRSLKRTMNDNMGKNLAKSYLMGSYGAAKYNDARAKGDGRAKAGVTGLAYGVSNRYFGQAPALSRQFQEWDARNKKRK